MKKLGFIGAGNMAQALARGLLGRKVLKPGELTASDIDEVRRRQIGRLGIATSADNLDVVRQSRAVLFAVKPQHIDPVLDQIAAAASTQRTPSAGSSPLDLSTKLFISIAAGVPVARFVSRFGKRMRIIRVMPNAPAMVGAGMAALVRAAGASKADEAFALKIFRSVGEAVLLKRESLLDAVTALSGSGPAYVYLFVKALAEAAANEGLPLKLAVSMALQTLRGAELNMRLSGHEPDELIRIVASPGGTTEAALRKLGERHFSDIVAEGLHAAAARSRELGRGEA